MQEYLFFCGVVALFSSLYIYPPVFAGTNIRNIMFWIDILTGPPRMFALAPLLFLVMIIDKKQVRQTVYSQFQVKYYE